MKLPDNDPRGVQVPPCSWRDSVVTHEISPGVTIPCQQTDLCRFCQANKRRLRKERAASKAGFHRKARHAAKQALQQGLEDPPTPRSRHSIKFRIPNQ
jgi:transposase